LHDDFAVTGQLLVEGATQNNTFNVPVYGCVNSTPTIVVELANQTSITQKDGCLYVYTTGGIDTVSAFEKIRYIKYGILE
jgi:hypothetical protein